MFDQKQIIFESSPGYIVLCIGLGIGCAFMLYRAEHPWSKRWNNVLFTARAILTSFLLFLLLGPIVKQINNLFEKPLFIVLYDNSISVRETTDSLTLQELKTDLRVMQGALRDQGFDVRTINLLGEEIENPDFETTKSDLTGAIKKIDSRFESSPVSGVVLVSDGIYNEGISPLYAAYPFPIHTVGLGDTTERTDIYIKDVAYNKIVYQGNKFPVHVEVMVKNLEGESINVSLLHRGKILGQQTKTSSGRQLLVFDFEPMAEEQGIQKLDVLVDIKPGEFNTANNRASVFVEVVEGKKKILLVAASPHPDVKAIREVVNKNSNYEFLLHIPGIENLQEQALTPDGIDLAIFNQSPDLKGKTSALFQKFAASRTSLLLILGAQSDLPLLAKAQMPIAYESAPRDFDEVVPVVNATFPHFLLSAEAGNVILGYPPVSVPFGKIRAPVNALPLLLQRVGSVTTEKPLLFVTSADDRRIGVMLGEGLWRWRLNEFDRFENNDAFDELFGKLVQYLSTSEDKRRFRSYPVKQEFSDTEAVIFESQVYNDIYEPVYGNRIEIELTDEAGRKTNYAYTTNPGNARYEIGGLPEGVYRYRSRTVLNQAPEEVRGEFAVVQRQTEMQNLTADFDLLRKLSSNTGGKFYTATNLGALNNDLQKLEATSIIHSEESYRAVVNLKWVFWLLLAIVSVEWFVRKYTGGY